ncbi:MAG: EpsG family protein [Alistipes sp.]|nr:EpsG family protein [Alistipes sp.]
MIPAGIYTDVFNFTVLGLVILAAVQGWSGVMFERDTRVFNTIFGVTVVVALILFTGLRPVTGHFGDTTNYALTFRNIQAHGAGFGLTGGGEWVFNTLMTWFAAHSDIHMFFLFCAAVYVGALGWALVRIFGTDFFVPLVVALSMFTFWSYGVNGVRNGMAASVMILALSFRRRWIVAVVLAVLAIGIHRSMMLTAAAAVMTVFVRNPRLWILGWMGSIVLSLVAGGAISGWLMGSGVIGDDRFTGYLTGDVADRFRHSGFRWDFLLYSAVPVVLGWYFIIRRGLADKFYLWLFNIYLTSNAFWILVIRANFSNRFAQISWFIMPLVLIYPFFAKRFWADQSVKTGTAVVAFYLYTFYTVFLQG